MSKKKEPYKIELEVDGDKVCEFLAYQIFIGNLVENNQKVPARVLVKFFSFLKSTEKKKKLIIDKYVQEKVNLICSRFKGTDYNFRCKHKVEDKVMTVAGNPLVLDNKVLTLESMVTSVFRNLLVEREKPHNKLRQKDKVIQFLYLQICDYRETKLKGKHKKNLSDYKVRVLAAVITQCIEFKLTEKENPNNSDLFQASRHAISKLKKGKPQA